MTLKLEVVSSLVDVPAAAWDACARSGPGADNPFVEHAFLRALETSGSVGVEAGWVPNHLVATEGDAVVGCAPMYLKNNSYGEYIFDWGWASGARRAGIPYYPKLVSAVPFTPATGPRLLVRDDAAPSVRDALADASLALQRPTGAHSTHWLFLTEAEADYFGGRGWVRRVTHQFHWQNPGYDTFDDYLEHLSRRRRKEVRRERAKAESSGLDIAVEPGTALDERDWAALYDFYRDTCAKKGAIPYLTRAFFDGLRDGFAHRVVVVLARRAGRPVAGTLNFRRGGHHYGRYWGALEEHEALHFECCYYRLVDFAIRERLSRFEAGAQGFHKVARGFLPERTYSAHLLAHAGMNRAVGEFCSDESRQVEEEIAWVLAEKNPFRGG